MRHASALILLALLVHVQSAPQFITFKDGRLGVNFAGYHAGVGIGGAAGNGAAGGLFAEAGTPHGQAARAGLGGSVDGNNGPLGGLFAGATAGGNVKAAAGLGGGVAGNRAAGSGFAASSAGGYEAASGLGGESSDSGSSGFKFSGTKSFGIPTAVIQETEVSAVPVNHKVHTELKLDSANEIDSRIGAPHVGVDTQSTLIEDIQPKTIIEKTIVHTHLKPSHHHHETVAHIGGYIGGEVHAPPPPVQKRVDVEVESSPHVGFGGFQGAVHTGSDAVANGGGQVTYKKEVAFEKNPNFFRDIFNIPISTLKAISGLLSNTAAGTSIKVEKSGSINAGGYGQSSGYGQGLFDGFSQYGQSAQISGGFGGQKYTQGGTGYGGHQFSANSQFNHGLYRR